MSLRNLKSVKSISDFDLLQETLADNSNLYSIWIKSEGAGAEIHCTSYQAAENLYSLLSDRDKYYL